ELVFVDKNDRAFLLDVSGKELSPEAKVVALPHAPTLALRRNGTGRGEALVVTSGRRASSKQAAEPAVLAAIAHHGALRLYTLGSPFDRIEQSEDGRFALLFKHDNADRLLDNPNEIAIVDLDKAPKDTGAVTKRTLRSFAD